jgi:hypothetical protein
MWEFLSFSLFVLNLFAAFTFFLEVKRKGVDAITFARWCGSVFKDMPKVASTAGTDYFDPVHEIAIILLKPYFVTGDYIIEAWPPRPRLKFGIRGKKLLSASSTRIDTFFFVIIQITRKGSFCAFLPEDMILFRSEDLFPIFV